MVKKEIIATKYTPSALKIGVKKSEKWEKRQKFPHDLLVLILGRLSLPPDWIWGRKNYLFVLKGGAFKSAIMWCTLLQWAIEFAHVLNFPELLLCSIIGFGEILLNSLFKNNETAVGMLVLL